MANANKRRGSTWESAVRDYLKSKGIFAERMPAGASIDRGDIATPGWTIECKNAQRIDLAGWLTETLLEQAHNGTPWQALVIKRKGRASAGDGYVVMTVDQLTHIMGILPVHPR